MKSVDTDSIDEYLERMCAFLALKVLIKSILEQLQLSTISINMSHVTRHTGKTHVKRVTNSLVRLAKKKQFMKPHELMSHTQMSEETSMVIYCISSLCCC